jgi:hypothetical protein
MKMKMKMPTNQTIIIIVLVIIIALFVLFATLYHTSLVNEKDISVQEYLHEIYTKGKNLEKKYHPLINPNYHAEKINNVVIVKDILHPKFFQYLQSQFMNKTYESSNTIIRKGHAIDFLNLHKNDDYNGFLELYYSNSLTDALSNVMQKPIQRTPLHDPNACSLLIYNNKGDHIDWHLDLSNYYGDRFVSLISIINQNKEGNGLSQNEFQYMYNGTMHTLQLEPNSMIIFKGSEILHKATSIADGEKRILLSMVFCDVCQEKSTLFSVFIEKIKNWAFYKR